MTTNPDRVTRPYRGAIETKRRLADRHWRHRLVALAAALLLAGCATNPVTGGQNFVMMSEEQEVQLGRQHHQAVLQQFEVLDTPGLQEYAGAIGESLARDSHRPNLVFHFTVLDDPMVNAFALPGGYIYITRGILAYMNSESHLAGVLGHEIGHVTARHSVRQQSQGALAGILGGILGAYTGSQAISDLSNVVGAAWISGYGRKHELEADRLGAEYLARSGYDPEEMIDVIGILKSQEEFALARAQEEGREPQSYHGLFSTHPRNDARLQEVIRAANRFRVINPVPVDREAFLRRLDGMTFGLNEEQGVLRGNQFYHRSMNFTVRFPDGWRVDNRPDRIVAVAPDNGAVIQLMAEDLNRRETPRQFLTNKFSNLSQGEALGENNQGYTGISEIDTPFGKRDSRVAAIVRDKRVFVALGVKRDGLLNEPFLDTVHSLRGLREDEKALASERRIRLIRARSGDTFTSLAEQTPLTNYAADQLRLLNGLYPDGEPEPGQLIKIVE